MLYQTGVLKINNESGKTKYVQLAELFLYRLLSSSPYGINRCQRVPSNNRYPLHDIMHIIPLDCIFIRQKQHLLIYCGGGGESICIKEPASDSFRTTQSIPPVLGISDCLCLLAARAFPPACLGEHSRPVPLQAHPPAPLTLRAPKLLAHLLLHLSHFLQTL